MTIKELEQAEWVTLDRSKIEQLVEVCDRDGMMGLLKEIETIYKEIAFILDIPYDEMEKLLKYKNTIFYFSLERFKSHFMLYGVDGLDAVLKLLFIPNIKSYNNRVRELLTEFYSLTIAEQESMLRSLLPYMEKCCNA